MRPSECLPDIAGPDVATSDVVIFGSDPDFPLPEDLTEFVTRPNGDVFQVAPLPGGGVAVARRDADGNERERAVFHATFVNSPQERHVLVKRRGVRTNDIRTFQAEVAALDTSRLLSPNHR